MPKPNTFPILYDELKTVSISFLTKQGYLKQNLLRYGKIEWSRNGDKTGSVSIKVNMESENQYLEFHYKCNEASINYKVPLIAIPSNLGKGVIWFFVCPYTGKRCRKLYLADTYFYHRSAFKGCMYEKQSKSKKSRYFDKTIGVYFKVDQLYDQLYKKHFKKHYAGKLTKRYLKITRQIQQAESVSFKDLQKALIIS